MKVFILILISIVLTACGSTPAAREENKIATRQQLTTIPEKAAETQKILIGIPPIIKPHVDSGVYNDVVNRIDMAVENQKTISTAAETVTKSVIKIETQLENKNDPLVSRIRNWSFLGIGVGILCIGASLVFARYIDLTIVRDFGILFFVSGIFGAVLATFMKTLITILFILLIVTAATGIAIVIWKMIKYRNAGLSVVQSVDELFRTGLVAKSKEVVQTLNKIQTPDARALVDKITSK